MVRSGRPPIILDQYRAIISEKLQAGATKNDIIALLKDEHGCHVSRRTLYRTLAQWDIQPHQIRTEPDDLVQERIQQIYFELGLSDEQIIAQLAREGYRVSNHALRRLRKDAGIFRRLNGDQIEQVQEDLRTFFAEERHDTNLVRQMGRHNLHVHIRQQQFVVSRDVLHQVYAEFHQDAIAQRQARLHRRRSGWTCPGPNYYWCVDGYCKLARYGIQVYAGIDAYSRCITWMYIGTSVTTAWSVFAQYLNVVKDYRYLPIAIRADRGTETALLAGAHFWLSSGVRRAGRQVPYQAPQDSDIQDSSPLQFNDCWSYGKSTQNVKIEAWWGQLCNGRAMFWRVSL
jgi:hypothetical protein